MADIIKEDDSWALLERVCTFPAVLMEVDGDEFWQDQWPKLLRKCCVGERGACLRVLLNIKKRGEDNYPPLPPQFLGWLAKGVVAGERNRYSIDAAAQQIIYSRLNDGPTTLSAQDGRFIVSNGGFAHIFYQLKTKEKDEILQHPQIAQAWKSWCKKKSNITIALDVLEEEMRDLKQSGLNAISPFEELVEAVPETVRGGIITEYCRRLEHSNAAVNTNDRSVQRMTRTLAMFIKNGWPTDHLVWEKWFGRICKGLETRPEGSEITSQLKHVILYTLPDGSHPPKGLVWNEAMTQKFFINRAADILDVVGIHESGDWVPDTGKAQAATWLRETMALWNKLESWGLLEENARTQWKEAQEFAMGADWRERINTMTSVLKNDPDSESVIKRWGQWRRWELEGYVKPVERERVRQLKM